MAVLNIGEPCAVGGGGVDFALENGEVLNGAGACTSAGHGPYCMLSAPAQRTSPLHLIGPADARRVELGARETATSWTPAITLPF